jgi:PAS domain-containing protein
MSSLDIPLLEQELPHDQLDDPREPSVHFRNSSSFYTTSNYPIEQPPPKPKRRWKITWFEVFLFVFCVLVIIASLFSSLTSFFLLSQKEDNDAKAEFKMDVEYNTFLLQKTIATYARLLASTQQYTQSVLYEEAGQLVHIHQDGFEKYVYESSTMPVDGVNTLNYLRIVPNSQLSSFIEEIRALGGLYQNFTMFSRDNNNTKLDLLPSPVYYPLVAATPLDAIQLNLGFDSSTRYPNTLAIQKAIATQDATATGKTISVNVNTPSIIIYAPVEWKKQLVSICAIAVRVDRLVELTLANTQMNVDGIVFMMDADFNRTLTFQERIMHVTFKTFNEKMRTNIQSFDKITKQMYDNILNDPQTVPIIMNITDHRFAFIFTPTDRFFNKVQTADRWIGLFVPLALCVILIVGALIFARVIYYNKAMLEKDNERVVILEEAQEKLQIMLNRIAIQDKKTRQTINAIQDYIVCTNTKGRILSTNTAFDTTFSYKSNELERGVYIGSLFPQLDRLFFIDLQGTVDTFAKTRFLQIPVQVTVNQILEGEEFERAKDNEEDEAYLIIARNTSEQEQLVRERKAKELVNNRMKWVEFDAQFKIPAFKKALLKFCEKEKNAENVVFLDAVAVYKRKRVEQRVEMQREIFNKFIKVGSSMQLNIPHTTSEEYRVLVNKRLGDEEVFGPLEDVVKTMIMQDSYPRFMNSSSVQDLFG